MSRSMYWSAAASVPPMDGPLLFMPGAPSASLLAEIKRMFQSALSHDGRLIVLPSSARLAWA